MLSLDHVIIRSADPAATLAFLAERAGLPVMVGPTEVAGLTSAIARAGAVDIEVLAIGEQPPEGPRGYGLGFVADRPLTDALRRIRGAGVPTSAPVSASVGAGRGVRRWRAAQVGSLLPDPFPAGMSTRPPGPADRLTERLGSALARVPAVARATTRQPGRSMVVVTEYGFDAAAQRAACPSGPEVLEVHVNTGGRLDAWSRVPLGRRSRLRLHDSGSPGLLRLVLAVDGRAAPEDFTCGDVHFSFRMGPPGQAARS